MDFADFVTFAWRNIKHNSLRTWLTMIGIFIGIATIVSLISLGQGMQNAITDRFSQLGVDKITFQNQQAFTGPPGTLVVQKLNDHDFKLMEQTKGIKFVLGRLIRQEAAEFRDNIKFSTLISMPSDSEALDIAIDSLGLLADKGRLLRANDLGKIVVGFDYGDKKIFDRILRPGDKLTIKGEDFEIVGIAKRLGAGFGEQFILMPEDDMIRILDIADEWDILIGQVEQGIDPVYVGDLLERKIRRDRDLEEWEDDFTVQTPQELLDSYGNILIVVQAVLIGIAAISLVVGGIGIMNTMYTAVLERTKEIGIIKAIGARNSTVLIIFLVESGVLGLVGGIIGLLLGIGFSFIVETISTYYFGTTILQASYSAYLLIGSLLFSFGVGSFAGTFPAIQASRLQVVDALRYTK